MMHRRSSWRATISTLPTITTVAPRRAGRRFASSFAARTSARATGTLVRWGLAGAAVYYYNTSTVFADERAYATQAHPDSNDADTLSSIDAISEKRRAQAKSSSSEAVSTESEHASTPAQVESVDGLEQEAQQQGAFNEETGEINWDCPCLGGMANGPCGEQFKEAFSCFVFSKEDPKGIDCIEHFKTMQNCFREHPDIYGAELEDDEDDLDAAQPGPQHAVNVAREQINDTVEGTADAIRADANKAANAVQSTVEDISSSQKSNTINTSNSNKLPTAGKDSEGELVPRAWHDSTGDNSTSK